MRQDYGADDIVTNSNTGGTYTGIVLDTSYIKKYITDKYENYTFKIIQDSIEEQTLLRNYQLTVLNDGFIIQHLVDYQVRQDGSINETPIYFERIPGSDLLPAMVVDNVCGYEMQWYSYQVCTWTPCASDANHAPGDSCNLTGDRRAQTECVTQWTTIEKEILCLNTGDPSNPSGPGSGEVTPGSGIGSTPVGSPDGGAGSQA